MENLLSVMLTCWEGVNITEINEGQRNAITPSFDSKRLSNPTQGCWM